MRDIPMFTTEFGIAALTLSEVPYKADAYIKILDTTNVKEFLKECKQFCTTVGAQRIYASGHDVLTTFPVHTTIWKMRCLRENLKDTDAALFPVQKQSLSRWREIYNSHMRDVPNAATLTTAKAEALLQEGNIYFVHRGDDLLGIGIAHGSRIDGIVSVKKGAGETVLLALNHALSDDYVEVEVASKNLPAVRLYTRLGFVKTEEIATWYKIS